jgi:hypothetical protein
MRTCEPNRLRKVYVRETNHNLRLEPSLQELLTTISHVLSRVVGTLGTSTKNDMYVRVAL